MVGGYVPEPLRERKPRSHNVLQLNELRVASKFYTVGVVSLEGRYPGQIAMKLHNDIFPPHWKLGRGYIGTKAMMLTMTHRAWARQLPPKRKV